MHALWDKQQATVADIVSSIDAKPPLAYSTVLTMLRILESKGFVRHEKEGRAFLYQPAVARNEARSGAVRHLLSRFFDNSPELLVASLLENEQIGEKELSRLKKLIAEHK